MTDDELQEGSPPRMRGKAKCQLDNVRCGRITPAYAGKSTKQEKHRDKARDHPRVCGEKCVRADPAGDYFGSPPRMRGKVKCAPQLVAGDRITPAYAGKRSVYPRS